MTDKTRRLILRMNAIFLVFFGGSGFLFDLRGYFLGTSSGRACFAGGRRARPATWCFRFMVVAVYRERSAV